jgi:hypothetical protein
LLSRAFEMSELSVDEIVRTINKRHQSLPQSASISAYAAAVPNATVSGTQYPCRNFQRTGKCSYGARCRFLHSKAPTTGECIECGSRLHGFDECPKRKARVDNARAMESKLTTQNKEMKELRALMAATALPVLTAAAPPPAFPQPATVPAAAPHIHGFSAAAYDPYSVYGVDSEIATMFGPARGPSQH